MKFIKGVNKYMKKNAYENSRLKYELLEKKRQGVKELIRKLKPGQVEFIKERFGFQVEPYLYEIKTKQFFNVRNLPTILKDIHYKSKRGKKFVVFKLTDDEKIILDEFNIKYRPIKYKIKLNV